jgi:hypothetical protein
MVMMKTTLPSGKKDTIQVTGISGLILLWFFMNTQVASGQIGSVPVAVDDFFQITEDHALEANSSTNDVRGDGTNTWMLLTEASNGTVKYNSSGTFSYTPNENYYGTDSFTYQLCDRDAECSQATVTVTIEAENDAPVLDPIGSYSVCLGALLTFTVTASDVDIPANVLTFSIQNAPDGADFDPATGVFSWTPGETQAGTYTVTIRVTDDGDPSLYDEETITISAYGVPAPAGPITGPATFTPGTSSVSYSVVEIDGAASYLWSYSGTGVTINGTGNSVLVDFAEDAVAGRLSVMGWNECFEGTESYLDLEPQGKTLTLSSVLLESLFNGAGTMRQAWNETGPQWPSGIADHVSIELHDDFDYNIVSYTVADAELTVSGTVIAGIPAEYSDTYYITVRHRNSVETTTSVPVSFASGEINYSFGLPANVYGSNLRTSGDGYYLIYGGDANQDGAVDTRDYTPVVNAANLYTRGYLSADIDGNGTVDTRDYTIMVNNANRYTRTYHP